MGEVSAGPGLPAAFSVTTPKLDRAAEMFPVGEIRGGAAYYSRAEQNRQQRVLESIERAFAALTLQVGSNASLIAAIQAAIAKSNAAFNNSTEALDTISIANSYTDPVGVLTAASSGTITIAAHTRVYGDGTRVSVNGGSLSGFSPGDGVTVYYVDAGRAGGAVAYQGSTSAVSQTGDTHVVGLAVIPQPGEVDTIGSGVTAPGYQLPNGYDPRDIIYESAI